MKKFVTNVSELPTTHRVTFPKYKLGSKKKKEYTEEEIECKLEIQYVILNLNPLIGIKGEVFYDNKYYPGTIVSMYYNVYATANIVIKPDDNSLKRINAKDYHTCSKMTLYKLI